MVQTSAARRQADVVRINQEAKGLDDSQESGLGVLAKLEQLNADWEHLKQSVREKQLKLEEALKEVCRKMLTLQLSMMFMYW